MDIMDEIDESRLAEAQAWGAREFPCFDEGLSIGDAMERQLKAQTAPLDRGPIDRRLAYLMRQDPFTCVCSTHPDRCGVDHTREPVRTAS